MRSVNSAAHNLTEITQSNLVQKSTNRFCKASKPRCLNIIQSSLNHLLEN